MECTGVHDERRRENPYGLTRIDGTRCQRYPYPYQRYPYPYQRYPYPYQRYQVPSPTEHANNQPVPRKAGSAVQSAAESDAALLNSLGGDAFGRADYVRRRRRPRFMGGPHPFWAMSTHATLRDSAY